MQKPLADLVRPEKIEDVVGQHHLLDKKAIFRTVIESGKIPNMIFYGPPGVGKTTLANIIAKKANMTLYKLNGTSASTDDIKSVIADVGSLTTQNGILLYLDEIQYLNKKQQQSLLEFVENGGITLIASTTENPYFYVYPALLSRCSVFEFKAVDTKDIEKELVKISKEKEIDIDKESIEYIAIRSNGDVRKALNSLEFLHKARRKIVLKDAKNLLPKGNINTDKMGDGHYDALSALHKSVRGSDSDAAIFYLARLLSFGDIVAACRRIMCIASEDIGLAYPQALPIVKSCVDMALQLGMPEARLPLSDAVIFLCNCPKSNSALMAIDAALQDVELGIGGVPPRQLQNKHFDGEDAAVKGQFYLYPHDFENHYVKQQYLPDDIKDKVYYTYGKNKIENTWKEYWDKVKK